MMNSVQPKIVIKNLRPQKNKWHNILYNFYKKMKTKIQEILKIHNNLKLQTILKLSYLKIINSNIKTNNNKINSNNKTNNNKLSKTINNNKRRINKIINNNKKQTNKMFKNNKTKKKYVQSNQKMKKDRRLILELQDYLITFQKQHKQIQHFSMHYHQIFKQKLLSNKAMP